MEDKSVWKSNDFYLSSCVLASGVQLLKLEKGQGKFATFVFETSQEEAEQIIQDHWDGNLRIPSRKIIEAINELKTRLHNGV